MGCRDGLMGLRAPSPEPPLMDIPSTPPRVAYREAATPTAKDIPITPPIRPGNPGMPGRMGGLLEMSLAVGVAASR